MEIAKVRGLTPFQKDCINVLYVCILENYSATTTACFFGYYNTFDSRWIEDRIGKKVLELLTFLI